MIKKPLLFVIVALATMLYSCEKEFDDVSDTKSNELLTQRTPTPNFPGDSLILQNPYSVDNMNEALVQVKLKALSLGFTDVSQFVIPTSHLYIKFKPRGVEDEALLRTDSTLFLFDYRLDVDYKDSYLDKYRVPKNDSIPDYYTAVSINYTIPNVPYEVIEELYIPEQDNYFDDVVDDEDYTIDYKIDTKTDFFNHLINEAFVLTGNEDELDDDITPSDLSGKWMFGSKWYPSGTINVWDDIVNQNVPVRGAQVLIRQWFTVRQGITDNNGYYSTGSVRGQARYIIQWERHHYSIRNGSLFQAETRGPRLKKEAWNININGGDDEYHAIIHSAANDYYYGTRFGLKSPPRNEFGKKQLTIAAREKTGKSYSVKAKEIFNGATISLKAWTYNTDRLYGTTIHELAHAAHREVDKNTYNDLVFDGWIDPFLTGNLNNPGPTGANNRRLLETWPTAVETYFALERYSVQFGLTNYSYFSGINGLSNFQSQTIVAENYYTSAGIDMIDDVPQGNVIGGLLPFDRVSGYTLKQLEDALVNANSWWQWRDHIKNNYVNSTEQDMDALFDNWSN